MQKTFSLGSIGSVAKSILKKLTDEKTGDHATLLALSGDLGAGKTTLTQALAKELGVIENIVSPTFVIMKLYGIQGNVWKHLIHIDAYRLESGDELKKLGFDDLIADKDNIIIIEWPEKVSECIPEWTHKVSLLHAGHGERHLRID